MKAIRIYLLLVIVLCSLPALSQPRFPPIGADASQRRDDTRRFIVVDVETRVPVDGVNVVGNGLSVQTDTLGYVTVPDSCHSLLFSHVNYESRLINLKEVRDTVFLISKLLNVKEVVVFGQAPNTGENDELRKQMTPSKADLQWAAVQPGDGINILGLINHIIPKKWKKSPKERRKERLKRVLEDY